MGQKPLDDLVVKRVRKLDSEFDLRRFWEHSVGCAMLADRIYTNEDLNPVKVPIEFDDYWISAILHDIGKMILGLFFWDHFATVLDKMQGEGEGEMVSFSDAEIALGDVPRHDFVGKILLIKSNVKDDLVEAVESHHILVESSSKLTLFLNLADNICKDVGLGYLPNEPAVYSDELLAGLEMDKGAVEKLTDTLKTFAVQEIKAIVQKCID